MLIYNFFTTGIGSVAGLFNLTHLLYVLISFTLIISTIVLTRKKSNEEVFKYIRIISIVVLVLEILKIIWNLTLRPDVTYEDYLPLYFCSFFIFTSLVFVFCKNKESLIYRFSKLFLFYGGVTGGLTFTVFPTTALMVFPFLHILSIHSLIYHSLMVVVSVWMLRFFKPCLKDIKIYGSILLIIELIIIIFNFIFEANFMMLNVPFGLVIFELLAKWLGFLYPFVLAIGQMLLTFYGGYLFYLMRKKIFCN